MPRYPSSIVALVAAVLVSGVGLSGCEKKDTLFCDTHPQSAMCFVEPDARIDPDAPGPCENNAGCKLATAPVCDLSGGDGVCVVCTATDHQLCTGTTPICNTGHTCEACDSNADCPLSDLCLPTGACAAETDIAYVVAGSPANTMCSKAMPCPQIMNGLTAVTGGAPRPYVKVSGSFDEEVTIDHSVIILAAPDAQLTRTSDGAIVTVNNASVVEIDDLIITKSKSGSGLVTTGMAAVTLKRVTLSENKGNGITCAGQSMVVSGSTVTKNEQTGIDCGGTLTVTGSMISDNQAGGIIAVGGSFEITNNFIVENGDKDDSLVGGAVLNPLSGTTNHFEFNTVVDNHVKISGLAKAGGVDCEIAGFLAPNNIIARNDVNANVNASNANFAGPCTYPTSTLATDVPMLHFVEPTANPRNYHIQAGSVAIGNATTLTTVVVDFDGQSRPTGDANDQGADELVGPGQ